MNKAPGTVPVIEHKPFKDVLGKEAYEELEALAKEDKIAQLFKWGKGGLQANNYVGVLPLKNAVVEILPKINLSYGGGGIKEERQVFFNMLQEWRRFNVLKERDSTGFAKKEKADMWELFIYLFLRQTEALVRAGIVSRYAERTENLTRLKGRLKFPQQAVVNAANRARFFVRYGELSQNHPANRLIRAALERLRGVCEMEENRRMQRILTMHFDAAPPSENIAKDWQKRPPKSRDMRHYESVLDWAGLFLHQHGFASFDGEYRNASFLLPMEQVFEDYVTAHISRHAENLGWRATSQDEQSWVKYEGSENRFKIRPDIVLRKKDGPDERVLVLDAKWKEIDTSQKNAGFNQSDIYQMYAYAKVCKCKSVALVYPRSESFAAVKELTYTGGGEDIRLVFYPFAVDKPEESARGLIDELTKNPDALTH